MHKIKTLRHSVDISSFKDIEGADEDELGEDEILCFVDNTAEVVFISSMPTSFLTFNGKFKAGTIGTIEDTDAGEQVCFSSQNNDALPGVLADCHNLKRAS